MKCWARWFTSWNQDCWEKYQKSQIYRWHHLHGRKQRGTKEPLDEGEKGEWKSSLKTQHSKNYDHGIWSHHFIANRRRNSGSSDGLFSYTPKSLQTVTAPMKLRHLLFGRKVYNQPRQHIKKWKHHFANKGPSSQAMLSPVVMYWWESWTIKKAERRRINAFELRC